MDQPSFEVVEVHKITDTDREGVYKLDVSISRDGKTERYGEYFSGPDDPHGANPAIRRWMSENPEAPVHPYVPPEVADPRQNMSPLSARQLRLGLLSNGFTTAQVLAVIDAMPAGADKETAKIEWEYATEFRRTHPLLVSVGVALGLTPEQMDTMWNEALTL